MRKLIFLTIFVFSFLFIGCSKEEKETITPEAPTIDEATPGNPSEKKINVKFIANEKEFEVKVNENTKVEKPDDPVKEGYIFSGWFTDLKFQEEYDFNNTINGDITLYAKFIKQASSVEVICNDILYEGEDLEVEIVLNPEGSIANVNVEIIVDDVAYPVNIENNKIYYDYNLYGKKDFEIYITGDNNISFIKKINFISKETIMYIVDNGANSGILKYYYRDNENQEFKYKEVNASETLNIYNEIYPDSYWFYGKIKNVNYYFNTKYLTNESEVTLASKVNFEKGTDKYFVMYIPKKYSDKDISFEYSQYNITAYLNEEFIGYFEMGLFFEDEIEEFMKYLNDAF